MNRITRHAQDRALWEVLSVDSQPTLRDDPREADGRGGVDAESLVNNRFEICEAFNLIEGRYGFIL